MAIYYLVPKAFWVASEFFLKKNYRSLVVAVITAEEVVARVGVGAGAGAKVKVRVEAEAEAEAEAKEAVVGGKDTTIITNRE